MIVPSFIVNSAYGHPNYAIFSHSASDLIHTKHKKNQINNKIIFFSNYSARESYVSEGISVNVFGPLNPVTEIHGDVARMCVRMDKRKFGK